MGKLDILGIHISIFLNELTTINFNGKFTKNTVDSILQPWRGKYLSIYGKITLINSLVLSQFTYLLMALPSPDNSIFKSLEQKRFPFIWNAKPDKIKSAYL